MGVARWLGPTALGVMIAALVLDFAGLIGPVTFDTLFALSVGGTLAAIGRKMGLKGDLVAAVATMAALALLVTWPGARLSPWFAIFALNLGVMRVFIGGLLLPDRRPVILQLVDEFHTGPAGSPAFESFVRGQCWSWVVMSLLTASAALVAMVGPEMRGPAGQVVLALAILQVIWFVLSHKYASWRHGRPETWLSTLRILSDGRVWPALRL